MIKLTSIVKPAKTFVYQGKFPKIHTTKAKPNNTSNPTFLTMDLSSKKLIILYSILHVLDKDMLKSLGCLRSSVG